MRSELVQQEHRRGRGPSPGALVGTPTDPPASLDLGLDLGLVLGMRSGNSADATAGGAGR